MTTQTKTHPYGKIPFMQGKKLALYFSLFLVIASITSLATKGLNLGIDFTGGTLVELGYQEEVDLSTIRSALTNENFDDFEVSFFGSNREVLIRIAPTASLSNAQISETVVRIAKKHNESVDMRRVEFVGPKIGEELTNDGALAVLYALLGILIYIAFRFEWRFAISSIIALIHDVIITLGFFSVLGLNFSLTVLAAILAVIGYSLNDTIVVFDRIRETFINMRKGEPHEVINKSLNDMLARTIMTSATTLFVLVALYTLGGEAVYSFAVALIIGVTIGTYSSIYVASSSSLWLGINKTHLIPPKKEGVQELSNQELFQEQMKQKYQAEQQALYSEENEKNNNRSQFTKRKTTKSNSSKHKKS